METYLEAYKRLGSHELARKALKQQAVRDEDDKSQRAHVKREGLHLAVRRERKLDAQPETLARAVATTLKKWNKSPYSEREEGMKNEEERYWTQLGEVLLQWKDLTELPQQTLARLASSHEIRAIKIMGNKLKQLPEWCSGGFPRLQTLNASNNRLLRLPDSIGHLTSLRQLYLQSNRLSALPKTVGALENLTTLDISSNQLEQLPDELGKLVSLQVLRLEANHLALLPRGLSRLVSLQELDITRNVLRSLALLATLSIQSEHTKSNNDDEESDDEVIDAQKQQQQRLEMMTLPDATQVVYDPKNKTVKVEDYTGPIASDPWEEHITGDEEKGSRRRIVPQLNLSGKLQPHHQQNGSTRLSPFERKVVQCRRQVLAKSGLGVWSCELDNDTGEMVFVNNIHRTTHLSMPKELDTFGSLSSLTVLRLGGNKLRSLPKSFSKLAQLKSLSLESNLFRSIPSCLGKLKLLEILDMSDNLIEEIPSFVGRLQDLRALRLQRNRIMRVPEEVGLLRKLERFWLNGNRIDSGGLPTTLKNLHLLADFQLNDNSILLEGRENGTASALSADERERYEGSGDFLQVASMSSLAVNKIHRLELQPSLKVFHKNSKVVGGHKPKPLQKDRLPALTWHMRTKERLDTLGPPPELSHIKYGITGERQETTAKFSKDIQQAIRSAKQTGALHLHWRDLAAIPLPVFSLSQELKELYVVGNRLGNLHPGIGNLKGLCKLELRNNQLRSLPSQIGALACLEVLLLDNNKLEVLPDEVCELTSLRELSLDVNALEGLPTDIGNLLNLETLHCEKNKLTELPETFKCLKKLETVVLSCNSLSEFPAPLCEMCSLKKLVINHNQLETLPDALGNLGCLTELHLSSNRLKAIPADLCHGPIAKSLKSLWLYGNRIVDLCDDFANLTGLQDVRLDFNQMRSPPEAFALKYGVSGVLEYCETRRKRTREVVHALQKAGFLFDQERLRPTVCDLFTGETGFLTKPMIRAFEANVDRYINGDFFQNDRPGVNGTRLVQELLELKKTQHHLYLETIIKNLLVVLELLEADKSLCSRYYFNPKVKRRWGKHGEVLPCYAINMEALFEDQTDPLQRAVMDKLDERDADEHGGVVRFREIEFQNEMFAVTPELLKNAVEEFNDPFHGKICASRELVRFKRRRHEKVEDGKKPAIVIPKLLYSMEEAQRCRGELKLIATACEEAEERVRQWFASPECEVKTATEVKRRRRRYKRLIGVTGTEILSAKSTLKKVQVEWSVAQSRKKAYDRQRPLIEHRFESEEEAAQFVEEAKNNLEKAKAALAQAKTKLKMCKKKAKYKAHKLAKECREDLLRKVLDRHRRYIVFCGRMHARANNLRRPWDGLNGSTFIEWMRYLDALERERKDIEEETASNNKRQIIDPEIAVLQAQTLQTALASVVERQQYVRRIESCYDNSPGWSSDDSDGEFSEEEYPMSIGGHGDTTRETDGEFSFSQDNNSNDDDDDDDDDDENDGSEKEGEENQEN